MHLNKDGVNERGHLGSVYLQKGECNILVSREHDSPHLEIRPYKLGGRTVNFKPLWVRMDSDNDGCPTPMQAPAKTKPVSIKQRVTDLLETFYSENGNVGKTNSDLARWVCEHSKTSTDPVGLKQSSVTKYISILEKEGLLVRGYDAKLYPNGKLHEAAEQLDLNINKDDDDVPF